MKAMILAAGRGTRLYPLTADRPKPVIPVMGVPLLHHVFDLLKESGINEVIINCHHEGDTLKEFLEGQNLGINLQFSVEEDLLGTAGGVKHAEDFFGNTFVVVYGDNLFDIDIQDVINFHRSKNALVTVALSHVERPEECGVVSLDESGRVTGFVEKPEKGKAQTNLVNAGLYVVEREVLDLIPKDVPYDFGHELFPQLLKGKGRIFGYVIKGYAKDIGTPRNYSEVHRDLLAGKASRLSKRSGWFSQGPGIPSSARIHETAVLGSPVLVGEDTVVEEGAHVSAGSVLGKRCRVGRGATIEGSIVWDGVSIGEGSRVKGSVLAEDCEIAERVTVGDGSIVGSGCLLEKDSILEPGVKLPPNTVVGEGEIVLHWC